MPIPTEPANLPAEERGAIAQVWSHYRRFSAWGLRDKTHEEPPWKNHYTPDNEARCSTQIPTSELAGFFSAEFKKATGEEAGAMGVFEADVAAGRMVSLEELRKELGC